MGLEVSWFKFSAPYQKLGVDQTGPLSALGAETIATVCYTLHAVPLYL